MGYMKHGEWTDFSTLTPPTPSNPITQFLYCFLGEVSFKFPDMHTFLTECLQPPETLAPLRKLLLRAVFGIYKHVTWTAKLRLNPFGHHA